MSDMPLPKVICDLAVAEGITLTPIEQVWLVRMSEPLTVARARHQGVSLAIAASGCKIVHGDVPLHNTPGNFLVMSGTRAYQAQVHARADRPYIALKIQLPPALIAKTMASLSDLGQDPATAPAVGDFCGPVTASLAEPVQRLLTLMRDPADSAILAPACIQEICYRLLRSAAGAQLRASLSLADHRLTSAVQFIEAQALGPLSIARIADHAGMSVSHLAHSFRSAFGMSPMQYRRQLRLNAARQQMLAASISVGQAAMVAGYASESHFSRDFKDMFGASPGAYLKAMLRYQT